MKSVQVRDSAGEVVFGPIEIAEAMTVAELKKRMTAESNGSLRARLCDFRFLLDGNMLDDDDDWPLGGADWEADLVELQAIRIANPRSVIQRHTSREVDQLMEAFRTSAPCQVKVPSVVPSELQRFCGHWTSEQGACRVYWASTKEQLVYEEILEAAMLVGILKPFEDGKVSEQEAVSEPIDETAEPSETVPQGVQEFVAELILVEEGIDIDDLELVGFIHIAMQDKDRGLQTRIKTCDDEDWAEPVMFSWTAPDSSSPLTQGDAKQSTTLDSAAALAAAEAALARSTATYG